MKRQTDGIKKLFLATFTVFALFCFTFCNWQLPQSVSVKTNAEFNASLGNAEYDLSEKLSMESIKQLMEEKTGQSVNIYDFKNSQDVLTYVLQYPMYNVPLDFGSYLDDLDLSSTLQTTGDIAFDKKISVPEISFSQTKQIKIPDISDKILASMEENLQQGNKDSILIYEQGDNTESVETLGILDGYNSINITGQTESITYTQGSAILITITKNDSTPCTSGFTFPLTVTLTDQGSGTLTEYASVTKDVANGGVLELALDASSGIPGKVKVSLSGQISGGVTSVNHNYSMKMTVKEGTAVKEVKGITASGIEEYGIEIPEIDQSISLKDMVDIFDSAVVGQGSVTVKALMPATWKSGINCTPSIKISGAGVTQTSFTEGDADGSTYIINQKLDLAGLTFAPTDSDSDIKVTGSLGLSLDNAVIEFTDGSSEQTIDVLVNGGIDTISQAVINLEKAGIPYEKSIPVDGSDGSILLPDEMLKYVRKIDFCGDNADSVHHYKHDADGNASTQEIEGLGIKFNLVSSLPLGNIIPVSIKSTVFALDQTQNISSTGTTDAVLTKVCSYPVVTLPASDGSDHYLDFTLTLGNDGKLNLVDLVPGSEYELSVNDFSFVTDFDLIEVNMDNKKVSGLNSMDGLDISSMLQGLSLSEEDFEKVKLDSLKVRFFAQAPKGTQLNIGDITMTGSVKVEYEKDSVSTTDYLVGSESTDGTISFVDEVSWPQSGTVIDEEDSESKYTQNINASGKGSFEADLSNIVNVHPDSMNIDYSLSMGSSTGGNITLYASTIDSARKSSGINIKIDLIAIVPFKLNIDSAINMDLMSLMDEEWNTTNASSDLLNRESASDYVDFVKYVDAIDYIKMNYTISNNAIELPVNLIIEDTGTSGFSKTMPFASGTNTFSLSADEIESVMTNYPFHPNIKLKIGDDSPSSMYIKRSSSLAGLNVGAKIDLAVKMNGDTSITVWGGQ